MNRIRKFSNKYEVLITPYHKFDSAMEIIMGGWKSEDLVGYSIKTFDFMDDALEEAYKYPNIIWNKLSSDHIENYKDLYTHIQDLLNDHLYITEFKGRLLSGDDIKETMFNRVKRNDLQFRLYNNLDDIISFQIINPWTSNCVNISKMLIKKYDLRIIKNEVVNKIICLTGETTVGTTYEIKIIPTIMFQLIEWNKLHPNVNKTNLDTLMPQYIKLQDTIDRTTPIL